MIINNKFTAKGFTVWGICALFFLYEFFLRTVIGTFQHPLSQDLQLSSFQFSFLSTTLFVFFYGACQIPGGIIVGNIGLKRSLLVGSLICSLATLGFSYSSNFITATIFRMMMGFGSTFGFICLLVSVHEWMPSRHNALFIGLSQFIGTLGPMLAAGPLDSLLETYDISWRSIFLYLSAVGVLILILVALFVENNQRKSMGYKILHNPEKSRSSMLKFFRRTQPWFIAIFSASIYFAIEYLSENEGRVFLGLKNISSNKAAYMITVAWVGYAIGCPALGFISDLIHRRKIIMVASAICLLISILFIIFSTNPMLLTIAFMLMGVGASGQSIGFAIIADQFKKQFIAVGFGMNNALIGLLPAVAAPFIGWIVDTTKTTAIPTIETYYTAFSVMIIIAVIAVLSSIFLVKETFGKSKVEFTYLSTS